MIIEILKHFDIQNIAKSVEIFFSHAPLTKSTNKSLKFSIKEGKQIKYLSNGTLRQ